jgi:hypothetical protein
MNQLTFYAQICQLNIFQFDGTARVHDLRSDARMGEGPFHTTPAPLKPVLSFADPWSLEALYAIGAGGGAGAHIVGGTARHRLVALWDVRAGGKRIGGWSAYGPGDASDAGSSPVYALHVERARVFATTQSRPFVIDFGPGVKEGTYDFVPQLSLPMEPSYARQRRGGGSKSVGRRAMGYGTAQVTKYLHTDGRLN